MIADILFLLALIVGPSLVLVMAFTQRWQWSLLPLSAFLIFWTAWFFLDTIVPFMLMGKVWWFWLAVGLLIGAEILGLLFRLDKVRKCNPEFQICETF